MPFEDIQWVSLAYALTSVNENISICKQDRAKSPLRTDINMIFRHLHQPELSMTIRSKVMPFL